ncbi:hypothetical protein [Neisseria perflava]|uniref:hypothetical protein n=1 Tax=Neisseria perflava TaxID=33053 RepID=UPI00209F1E8E|nr:hypothetical protein [Neisseria perflava]MCP1660860.1 endogenous inhibitor of DNA gyrase (YacG/DUF329 family) [Neisseria perflava]MCP1772497.1 endogenous inhibitor of DNA gyrase (YacG/DUF329 family) [Neisseria perflava]
MFPFYIRICCPKCGWKSSWNQVSDVIHAGDIRQQKHCPKCSSAVKSESQVHLPSLLGKLADIFRI